MFARVTTIQGTPQGYDQAVKVIQDQAVPGAKGIPGLLSGYWALDRDTGKAVTFTVYDSEESLKASEPTVRLLREKAVADAGAKIVSVDTYEIVAQI
jgi:hypothetical protein